MKKALVLFIFSAFSMFLLCSCDSTPDVKNQSELMQDLQNSQGFYHDVSISDLTITKRQTNKDNLQDIVYVEVQANNDSISCTLSYVMTYGLYDEGWILDDVVPDYGGTWYGKPLTGVTDGRIVSAAYSNAENLDFNLNLGNTPYSGFSDIEILSRNLDLDVGQEVIDIKLTKEFPYGIVSCVIRQMWTFDSINLNYFLVSYEEVEIERTLQLSSDLEGTTWEYTDLSGVTGSMFSTDEAYSIYIDEVSGNYLSGTIEKTAYNATNSSQTVTYSYQFDGELSTGGFIYIWRLEFGDLYGRYGSSNDQPAQYTLIVDLHDADETVIVYGTWTYDT